MIEPEQVKNGRMEIMDVDLVLAGIEPQLVGAADDLTASDAAAGQPHRETVRIVIAAVASLGHGRAAELATPDHQRAVE